MAGSSDYEPPRLGRGGCFGVGVLICLFLFCLLAGSCVSQVVVTRAVSPDGSLTATIVETNGGATTDFGYQVIVARNWPIRWDHFIGYFYGARRSDCAYGVNVRWVSSSHLLISYKTAKSRSANPTVDLLGRTVRVTEKVGADDAEAPCGGMDFSQSGLGR